MRLSEALRISVQPGGERVRRIHLTCGFEPLHLATFLKARLTQRFPGDTIEIVTGLFGDLEGNLQRAARAKDEGAVVFIEWSDLDPRLGYRGAGGWSARNLEDIAAQVEDRCRRLEDCLSSLARAMPVVLVAPTLPLPPLAHQNPVQASALELKLWTTLGRLLEKVNSTGEIRVVSAAHLDVASPPAARHDVRTDLQAGFPYALAHADEVARAAVDCLFPTAPKKGLITDLDQTLWKGILGDDGPQGVSWSLDSKAQVHALYQQVVASLAESGVLVAVASKNDPGLVEEALRRSDLLLGPDRIFPVEAGWWPKSAGVERILRAWNVAADSVVFVDDSPLELEEVSVAHAGITPLQFQPERPAEVVGLLRQLRALFGKSEIREEDRIRLQSLRAAGQARQEGVAVTSREFLAGLAAQVTFVTAGAEHRRAFELVNKTNQFNLNGRRYTEAEWRALAMRDGAFLVCVSYADRFGPLGQIAVVGGRLGVDACEVDVWVMSCRAFSRQVEHETLRQLFAKSGASAIRFDFSATERNGPLQSFLDAYAATGGTHGDGVEIAWESFVAKCPELFNEVTDQWTI